MRNPIKLCSWVIVTPFAKNKVLCSSNIFDAIWPTLMINPWTFFLTFVPLNLGFSCKNRFLMCYLRRLIKFLLIVSRLINHPSYPSILYFQNFKASASLLTIWSGDLKDVMLVSNPERSICSSVWPHVWFCFVSRSFTLLKVIDSSLQTLSSFIDHSFEQIFS